MDENKEQNKEGIVKEKLDNKDEVKDKTKDKDVISVKKSVLDNILLKQEEQEKELKVLREVADKSRLHWFEEKTKGVKIRTVKLTTFKGLVILGWRMVVDEVFQDANGVWQEKQILEIHLEDGTKASLNYIDFVRRTEKITAEIISKEINEEQGTETLKVRTKTGKEYKIGTQFVN